MTKAVALFSGGLDSLLAARLVMEQGIEVVALQFITPFFNYKHKGREAEAAREFKEKYGLDCAFRDVTDEYVGMLRQPRYGYGKNFNPCIDCKVFMMGRAKAVMEELGADFIVSGEVLGQRPMSQRRDALRIVERDS
jgi:tRNA U34 2-thiouridine synthase MnmA/TrmU